MSLPSNKHTHWSIIGAGPAGMGVVGKLLDAGVPGNHITWIDPEFKGGDIHKKWQSVSSNTKVGLFLDYLNASDSFNYKNCSIPHDLNTIPRDMTCLLEHIAVPLEWVAQHLAQKVNAIQGMTKEISAADKDWNLHITTEKGDTSLLSSKVVVAIGAKPSSLSLQSSQLPKIPLETMVDLEKLRDACSPKDTVAVFGSSHSAIIALYNLEKLGISTINFYRSPLKYAIYKDGWILHDNTGLKGYSAEWARENLDGKPDGKVLKTLERYHIHSSLFEEKLYQCTKVIEAVGFKRRESLLFPAHLKPQVSYCPQTGEIAPNLYGVGIAFPQGAHDRAGNFEYRVGMWKFMDHISTVLPLWMK